MQLRSDCDEDDVDLALTANRAPSPPAVATAGNKMRVYTALNWSPTTAATATTATVAGAEEGGKEVVPERSW